MYKKLPKTVFTDRGAGMYSPQGLMVGHFEAALGEAGFSTYWGHDASTQAPDMPDVLLHETAVAMFRKRMRKEKPSVAPWNETVEMWQARAQRAVNWMNSDCDLDGLCRQWPRRLFELRDAGGDRLPY